MKYSLLVLAAGKGTRFLPLTVTTPKPLLKIANKTSLEHNLDSALPFIDEIILVTGYLEDKIRKLLGQSYKGIPVKYISQKQQLGNAQAVNLAKEVITSDQFILMYGDDLYDRSLFEELGKENLATIGRKEANWQNFGIFQVDKLGNLIEIIEKPKQFVGDLANIGLYLLDKDVFDYFGQIKPSVRGELEFTDMLTLFAQKKQVKVIEVKQGWTPLTYPWHLLSATEAKLSKLEDDIQGEIEAGVTIKGRLKLGKGSVIKSGAYLEGNFVIGENCVIGPNCYLKYFAAIDDGCVVGNGVEICRSILGTGVNVRHLSYIGDSVIGNNVNIAAGTITSNLKHTQTSIKVKVGDKLVDSGLNKLGAIIGDDVRTGTGTLIYPGRKLSNEVWTLPGEVIKKDKR